MMVFLFRPVVDSWSVRFRCLVSAVVLSALGQATALGDILYTGYRNSGITRIDEQTGQVLHVFATSQGDGFQDFRGIALGPDRLLYVSARETASSRFGRWGVYRFDPYQGTYVDSFIRSTSPLDWISFDSHGDLYAVRAWSNSLVQYDGASGEYLRTVLDGDDFEQGVGTFAIGNLGELFVTTDASQLARYDLATGERIGPVTDLEQLGLSGYGFDQMAFGPDGDLYATYNYRSRDMVKDGGIMKFAADTGELLGTLVDDLPAFGAANGGTLGLAFASEGDLYVGSQHASSILRLDAMTFGQTQQLAIPGGLHSATFMAVLPVPEPSAAVLGTLGVLLLLSSKIIRAGQSRRAGNPSTCSQGQAG